MPESSAGDLLQPKLAHHVRWVDIEGRIFILDLRRGEYVGLDKEHADAWRALAVQPNCDRDSGGTSRDKVLVAARARGWLAVSPEKHLPRSSRRKLSHLVHLFPVLSALVCLIRSYASMRVFGFEKTYTWARAATSYSTRAMLDYSRLESAKAVFLRAERFIVSRRGMEDCLPRSLALFVFLRALGFEVRHCIGIRCFPFAAHAWVESIVRHQPVTPGAFVPIAIIE